MRTALIVFGTALAAATAVRHGLVEPAELTARCDASPWTAADCVMRTLSVQTFVHQRVGWVALMAGLVALGLRDGALRRWLSLMALACGAWGLMLYSSAYAAPAVLLAALAALPCDTGADDTPAEGPPPGERWSGVEGGAR
jgi:hypothetical protein